MVNKILKEKNNMYTKFKDKPKYTIVATANITDKRDVVISTCSKGGFTLGQRLETSEDDGNKVMVFLKGAIHVNDLHGMYNIRDAINMTIKMVEEGGNEEDVDWDKL